VSGSSLTLLQSLTQASAQVPPSVAQGFGTDSTLLNAIYKAPDIAVTAVSAAAGTKTKVVVQAAATWTPKDELRINAGLSRTCAPAPVVRGPWRLQ